MASAVTERSKNHVFRGLLASGSVRCLSKDVSALFQIYTRAMLQVW